jgi:UDPglucose 6-dehydrogenase
MIEFILSKGGIVNAYDPIANASMLKLFNNISYFDNAYDAVKGADALVVMTEWNEFRALDLPRIKKIMRSAFILDTRNIINMSELSKLGFVYDNIGRIKI